MKSQDDFSNKQEHIKAFIEDLKVLIQKFDKFAQRDFNSLSDEEKLIMGEMAHTIKQGQKVLQELIAVTNDSLIRHAEDMFMEAKFKAMQGDEHMNQFYLYLKDSYEAHIKGTQNPN